MGCVSVNAVRLGFLTLVLAIAADGARGAVIAPTWSMRGHDPQHTGRSDAAGPGADAHRAWSRVVGGQSGPSLAPDGDILVGTGDGLLRLAPDGTTRWQKSFGFGVETYMQPAVASDGTSYISAHFNSSSGRGLFAFDNAGNQLWEIAAPGSLTRSLSSPVIDSSGNIFYALANYGLLTLRPDGTQKWSRSTGRYYVGSPALSADGQTLYVGDISSSFDAINAQTGQLVWSVNRPTRSSPAIGADGTIYVGTDSRSFMAINPNGTVKWEFFAGTNFNDFFTSPAIAPDGTIIASSTEGTMYAFRQDGSVRWSKAGSSISSFALDRDGNIFVAAGGLVQSYTIDGADRWQITGLSQDVQQPAIAPDGTLYAMVGTDNQHQLWAIIPEPGGLSLLIVGSLVVQRRRR